MRNGIAVVGDKDSVLAFKAIGIDAYPVDGEMQARNVVRELARSYSVIFITDAIAAQIESLLKRYKTRPYPVVVPIPSAEGITGFGMAGIKSDVEKAIGSDIIFGKEE